VSEECIGDTIKAYFKFEADLFDAAKKAAPKNTEVGAAWPGLAWPGLA
jgi:hypothetical protein